MAVSLPARLALLVVVLAASLMAMLYKVHKATQFHTVIDRGELADLPAENTAVHHKKGMKHKDAKDKNLAAIKSLEGRRKMMKKEEHIDNVHNTTHQKEEEDKPMNIILFYADDWRHDTLGAAGNPIVKTPVLDALAEEGIRFTENCVTTSICWVSRVTLYSGQYLARHHFEMLGRGRTITLPNGTRVEMKFEVSQNETMYSLLKQKAGYAVGHAGKLGIWVEMDRALNFDFMVEEDGWHWRKIGDRMWHITQKNTADALRFLMTRNKKKPFFLNVAYFATHAVDGDTRQYLPQNESLSMYENDTIPMPEDTYDKMPPFFGQYNEGRTRWRWRFDNVDKHQSMMKNYYRMASEVDTSVGIILKQLEMEGVLDNTLIIFTTDNGNFHAEHGLADKWYPHQESIRVPLIIKDPRMDDEFKGTLNDEFTLNIDLTATILKAAGLEPLPSMMGRDMSELYTNGGLKASTTITAQSRRKESASVEKRQYPDPASDGDGKYHSGHEAAWRTEFFYEHPMHTNPDYIPASEALVRKEWKYFYWPNHKYEQLFDMKNDPGELNDLFNSTDPMHQMKLKWMRKRFIELKMLAHSDLSIIL